MLGRQAVRERGDAVNKKEAWKSLYYNTRSMHSFSKGSNVCEFCGVKWRDWFMKFRIVFPDDYQLCECYEDDKPDREIVV